jgi:outer membrane lipoprotein-sorting protein
MQSYRGKFLLLNALVISLACLFLPLPALAIELSPQEILDKLKAHQDIIKTIHADFEMTIFGVGGQTMEQKGTYVYQAPDEVVMTYTFPMPQAIKIKGTKSQISTNAPSRTSQLKDSWPGSATIFFNTTS